MYADFVNYRSGVYTHTFGGYLGKHAIKMLGLVLCLHSCYAFFFNFINTFTPGVGQMFQNYKLGKIKKTNSTTYPDLVFTLAVADHLQFFLV